MTVPQRPKIYHITHVDNLPGIVSDGGLVSDARMAERGGPAVPIGLAHIKRSRLQRRVKCRPADRVGDYVPFNFCPRSVMLSVIWYANNPDLVYKLGQSMIVHLEADARTVIEWAERSGGRWAISLGNARAAYSEFRCTASGLHDLDWSAIQSTDFRQAEVKERKQAEFLMHHEFPWGLVERIGVHSAVARDRVTAAIASATHHPEVSIQPSWYFPAGGPTR
jgi:hypothetical protein